jgi:NitT/TauT family transport system substrate-binding protein
MENLLKVNEDNSTLKGILFFGILAVAIISVYTLNRNTANKLQANIFLLWEPQAQFAGYYAAEELGFFDEEGLSVTIQHNLGVGESLQQVKNKNNAFVVTQFINYLDWIAKDKNLNLLSVINTGCNLGWSSGEYKTVDEFRKGLSKNNLYTWWGAKDILLKTYLSENGFSYDNIENRITTNYPSNLSNHLMALSMTYNEATELNSFKSESKVMHKSYCELGMPIFEDVLVGSNNLSNDSMISRKIVKAIWRGWDWVVLNPEAAIEIVMKRNPRRTSVSDQQEMLKSFTENLTRSDDVPSKFHEQFQTSTKVLKQFELDHRNIANEHLALFRKSTSLRDLNLRIEK